MSNTVQFTINLDGNAYTGIAQLDKVLGKFNVQATSTHKLMERIRTALDEGTFAAFRSEYSEKLSRRI